LVAMCSAKARARGVGWAAVGLGMATSRVGT